MGQVILLALALLLITQAFIGLPGSVMAAIIVPGNLVEGGLQFNPNPTPITALP